MYADDTTIYFNLEDFSSLNREYEINRELEKINTWFQLNKLTLNVEKTKCMLFHKRRTVGFFMHQAFIDMMTSVITIISDVFYVFNIVGPDICHLLTSDALATIPLYTSTYNFVMLHFDIVIFYFNSKC